MIADLAHLALKKLVQARSQAKAQVLSCRDSLRIVASAAESSALSIELPSEVLGAHDSLEPLIDQADYLTVIDVSYALRTNHERILTVARAAMETHAQEATNGIHRVKAELATQLAMIEGGSGPRVGFCSLIWSALFMIPILNSRDDSWMSIVFFFCFFILIPWWFCLGRIDAALGKSRRAKIAKLRAESNIESAEGNLNRARKALDVLDAELQRVRGSKASKILRKKKNLQSECRSVVLIRAGDNIIGVVKTIRAWTGASLAEAKKMGWGVRQVLKSGLSDSDAEKLASELEALGAEVEVT